MIALKGPVNRCRGLEAEEEEEDGDVGVEGEESDALDLTLSTKEVIPPSRSVAWFEPWTCEPAISLCRSRSHMSTGEEDR